MGSEMPSAELIERSAFALLESALSSLLEVKFWQDGTKSDCGVRFNRCDLWLGLQIKATGDSAPPTNFNVHGGPYDVPLIAMWLNDHDGAMLLSVEDQRHEFETSTWRVQDAIHRDSYWMTWKEIAHALERLIIDGDGLLSEQQLRSQLGRDDRKEFEHIMLSRRFYPEKVHQWPPCVKLLYDNVCDGKREQFKTAFHRKSKTVFECPNFSHKVNGIKVPFEPGQVDVFCFCAVMREKKAFLIWKIPEDVLLPTPKTSITLHVPLHLHQWLFGRLPRWNREHHSLAPYLEVFELE
jgi:hypothetical protein